MKGNDLSLEGPWDINCMRKVRYGPVRSSQQRRELAKPRAVASPMSRAMCLLSYDSKHELVL